MVSSSLQKQFLLGLNNDPLDAIYSYEYTNMKHIMMTAVVRRGCRSTFLSQ